MEIVDIHPGCCFVCNKHFKHYKLTKLNKSVGLKEVDLITSHASCRNLIKKRDKLYKDLLEVEYDLFAKMSD
jgi:hypothetical protein